MLTGVKQMNGNQKSRAEGRALVVGGRVASKAGCLFTFLVGKDVDAP